MILQYYADKYKNQFSRKYSDGDAASSTYNCKNIKEYKQTYQIYKKKKGGTNFILKLGN